MKIILASSSPRRRELMNLAHFDFEVLTSDIKETRDERLSIEEQSKDLAYKKAKFIFDNTQGDRAIIGADTLVVKGDKVFGKPKDRKEAISMLKEIQGDMHYVYTSIAVLIEQKENLTEYNELHKTEVYVNSMESAEIERYIDTERPFDKAGAYAIQSSFAVYIDKINGNYSNIIGLPIQRIYEILKENDIIF